MSKKRLVGGCISEHAAWWLFVGWDSVYLVNGAFYQINGKFICEFVTVPAVSSASILNFNFFDS
jgi:hypothetical protein